MTERARKRVSLSVIFRDAVAKEYLIRIAAVILERQDNDHRLAGACIISRHTRVLSFRDDYGPDIHGRRAGIFVASAVDRRDHVSVECLSQCRDVYLERILLDRDVGPDRI